MPRGIHTGIALDKMMNGGSPSKVVPAPPLPQASSSPYKKGGKQEEAGNPDPGFLQPERKAFNFSPDGKQKEITKEMLIDRPETAFQQALARADDKYYDPMTANMEVAHVGMTRREKEMFFTTVYIMDRLKDLRADEIFELNKWVLFMGTLICGIIGSCLIMIGLAYGVLFQQMPKSMVAVGFGAAFLIPFALWVKFWICPGKKEGDSRKQVYKNRDLMRSKGIEGAIEDQAKDFSRPPTQRIPMYFNLRKKKYKVIASTMQEFCELIEKETGIPMCQQMMKYNGEYIELHLDWRLVEDYKFRAGFEVVIYNRGAWETECEQLRLLKTNPKHSVHGKIEIKVEVKKEPNAVQQMASSISQELVDELHREVEAVSTYLEAAAIGAFKIKPGKETQTSPAKLKSIQEFAYKIEQNKIEKLYKTKDPRLLAQMEKDLMEQKQQTSDGYVYDDYDYDRLKGKSGQSPSGSPNNNKKEQMNKYLQQEKNRGAGYNYDDDDDDDIENLPV